MMTLNVREIQKIVRNNLPIGLELYGMEGMRQWILTNHLDNHGWLDDDRCYRALDHLYHQGFLVKVKKDVFTRNPLTI